MCSFAFLDFYSPGEATKALTNRMNHYFDERKLALQYASVEATKRSGGRDPSKKVLNGPRLGLPQRKTAPSVEKGILKDTRSREPPSRPTEDEAMGEVEVVQRSDEAVRPVKDKRGKKWEAAGRPRPGATLAMAKREKVGIIEGKGEKIVFD